MRASRTRIFCPAFNLLITVELLFIYTCYIPNVIVIDIPLPNAIELMRCYSRVILMYAGHQEMILFGI